MNDTLTNETPREDWTLDRLSQFAQRVAKRNAHDAWLLGRAFTIAKAKAKAEKKRIEAWRKEWIPFVSQPTLSRYEAVGRLAEEDVQGKELAEVYRLLGLIPQKEAVRSEANLSMNRPPACELPHRSGSADDDECQTAPAPEGGPPQPPTCNVVPARPEGEADSLLKRLAPAVALLTSIVRDLPSLDATLDATFAINDAMDLLQQIRTGLEKSMAA